MASRTRSAARWMGLGLSALAVLSPIAAYASAVDVYYERALMSAANERCRLFTPDLAAALAAAQAQARGAALREGAEEAQLTQAANRARARAATQACNSADLATAAARVREAFAGFARLQKMTYPGDIKDWSAVRQASTTGRVWNLSQSTTFGRDSLTFGLAGRSGAADLVAVVKFADGAVPYSARLVMRDTAKSTRAYLDARGGSTRTIPLTQRMTPRAQSTAFIAEARFTPDPLIAPPGVSGALAYRFPAAAVERLAALDPREAVAIEFLFSSAGRDSVRTAYVEVGDFAAGRAFLAVAQR